MVINNLNSWFSNNMKCHFYFKKERKVHDGDVQILLVQHLSYYIWQTLSIK